MDCLEGVISPPSKLVKFWNDLYYTLYVHFLCFLYYVKVKDFVDKSGENVFTIGGNFVFTGSAAKGTGYKPVSVFKRNSESGRPPKFSFLSGDFLTCTPSVLVE